MKKATRVWSMVNSLLFGRMESLSDLACAVGDGYCNAALEECRDLNV